MSPRSAHTRSDLLQATRDLLETEPFSELSLARVAKHAGVSRQAVYLHFDSKIDLLLALVDWMDESSGLGQRIAAAFALQDPVEVMVAVTRVALAYNRDIADVGLALRAARATDEAAASAWDDRMASRLAAMRSVMQQVDKAARLQPGWTVRAAVDVIFVLTSLTMYEDLVRERRWSQRRYEEFVLSMITTTLIAP